MLFKLKSKLKSKKGKNLIFPSNFPSKKIFFKFDLLIVISLSL